MLEFKGMQIASAWDIYQSVVKPALNAFRGRGNTPSAESKKSGAETGSETIQENRAQEGELYALLAWLSTIHMDDGDNARSILEYRVKRTELHIFPKLVDALPPGAVKRLMQTVAVEVTTVKRKKTTGFTQHKDHKDPSKSKQTPITSEWDDKLNLKGQQVISALTWLVTNQGSDTEDKRIAAIAKTLKDLRILENAEDRAMAAAKATADKAGEWQRQWKEYYGKHDTALHELAALLATDRETLRRITESERAKELRAAVEAAPEGERRARHEAYQLYLQEMVRHFRDPAIIRAQAIESGVKPPRFALKHIVIGLAILCVALVAIIGMVPTN